MRNLTSHIFASLLLLSPFGITKASLIFDFTLDNGTTQIEGTISGLSIGNNTNVGVLEITSIVPGPMIFPPSPIGIYQANANIFNVDPMGQLTSWNYFETRFATADEEWTFDFGSNIGGGNVVLPALRYRGDPVH